MYKSILKLTSGSAFGLILAGCAVGPNYQTPVINAPSAFSENSPGAYSTNAVDVEWWRNFRDETLDGLVNEAIENNHDLRIATARLTEARALLRETSWAFAPSGSLIGGYERSQLSNVESHSPNAPSSGLWSGGLEAAWELDLFGRLRRSVEATSAELDLTVADHRAVQVALLAEVAFNYFSLRGTEEALEVVLGQAQILERGLALIRSRIDAGRGTPLDSAQAEALLHETRALVPPMERDLTAYRNRLAVLLGRQPEGFLIRPASPISTLRSTGDVAIGSPVELLRRRPDVVRAERSLAAATARIGIHTASLFPEVSISGFFRFATLDLKDVGNSGADSWSGAPTVRWGILDYGLLRARLEGSEARAEAVLAAYERAVLVALEDVENAIVRYRSAMDRSDSLELRSAAGVRARDLALRMREAGSVDPLVVLDAERTALAATRDAVSARTDQQLALVSLYRALGGGWENSVN